MVTIGGNNMTRFYRAAQVSKPGTLEIVERETPSPNAGEVLISVEACGICGADAPQGRLVLLGAGKDPLPVSAGHLVRGERSVLGSITGAPFENERTLDFGALAGVRPRIETMPLERAAEAVARMKSGQANFRMVLTMTEDRNAHQ
jgi:alcohol dehydrogenase